MVLGDIHNEMRSSSIQNRFKENHMIKAILSFYPNKTLLLHGRSSMEKDANERNMTL
jgi:hypothetical protein